MDSMKKQSKQTTQIKVNPKKKRKRKSFLPDVLRTLALALALALAVTQHHQQQPALANRTRVMAMINLFEESL
jgi:uncharacterized protein HemX